MNPVIVRYDARLSGHFGCSTVEYAYHKCVRCHRKKTNQLKNCNFHHALVEVRRFVLNYLYGHDFMCFHILTFHDLSEGTLTQDIENQIPIEASRQMNGLVIGIPIGLTYDPRPHRANH